MPYKNKLDRQENQRKLWEKKKDKINEKRRELYKNDEEYRKKRIESDKRYYDKVKNNPEYWKEYYDKNKDKDKEYKKKYEIKIWIKRREKQGVLFTEDPKIMYEYYKEKKNVIFVIKYLKKKKKNV